MDQGFDLDRKSRASLQDLPQVQPSKSTHGTLRPSAITCKREAMGGAGFSLRGFVISQDQKLAG
jgi:hypothetical protein